MSPQSNKLLPLATACVGVLAAFLATPLLFPPSAAAESRQAESRPASRAEASATPTIPGQEEALAKLGAAMVAVAGLGGAALWLVRRAKSGRFARRRGRSLEVLETLPLPGKKCLAVARVYDRVLVLGLGEGRVSLLVELREDEAGVDADALLDRDCAPKASSPFRALLQKLATTPAPREVSVPPAPRRAPAAAPAAPARRPTIAELEREENERAEALAGDLL